MDNTDPPDPSLPGMSTLGKDNESPFMNSVIDYYQAWPVKLKHITLANFVANYDMKEHRGTTQHI